MAKQTSLREGADFEWNFCQASPPRLELFTIVKKQNGSNILRISKLSQNKDECVPYPNVAQLEPLITVSRVTAPSIPETFELVTDLFRAIGGHAALANAKYRSLKTFADIEDWDRISEQSKEVSSRLSAILKEPAADVHTDGHVAR